MKQFKTYLIQEEKRPLTEERYVRDMPIELTPQIQEAREKCQWDIVKLDEQFGRGRWMQSMFVRIVSSAAVFVLAVMLLIPQAVKARGLCG